MTASTSREHAAKGLQLAMAQLTRGELSMAERTLQRSIKLQPRSGDAWNLMSVVANAAGRGADALAHTLQALELEPLRADFHFSRGRALKSTGRLDEAVLAYERALELRPQYVEVMVSLGIALRLLGRTDAAIDRYREALRIRPEFPEALGNLGNALAERIGLDVGGRLTAEDLREAEQVQRQALALAPNNPNLLHNLGIVLKLTGRYEEAVEALNRALGLDSSRVDTCLQFGDLLHKEGRFDLAKELYTRWLQDHPPHAGVMLNLASTLTELGETDDALAWIDRVSALAPALPEADNLRGRIALHTFRNDVDASHAVSAFRTAIDARPDYVEAVCSYLMSLCYVEEDPAALLAEHRRRLAALGAPPSAPAAFAARHAPQRIRLGYVSYDYKRHSVAYFLEGILETHDRSRFEVHAYKTNAGGDAVTDRLKALCDQWIECGHLSDAQLAERVRADGIDILIDLSGLTSGSRLGMFNHRPAPCQITYLGYPTTTGATCFDFRLTDPVIDPVDEAFGAAAHSSEPLLRCPQTMFCYRPGLAPDVGAVPALAQGHVTFGSFNNLAKAGAHTLSLWHDVLAAVPRSRLLLKSRAFLQQGNREFIRRHFVERGIDAERIVLQPWTADVQGHLAAYADVDIGLDTFPFNGATTTCEALYMGVPVVSLTGRTHASRMGASILGAIGLSELVAHDDARYVAIAAALAGDLQRLRELRAGMRPRVQASPLMSHATFTRGFEALLEDALARTTSVHRDAVPDHAA